MSKGDGSIYEIKKKDGGSYTPKHWRVTVSLGRDPVTGHYDKVQRNVVGSKADARRLRDQINEEVEQGLNFKDESLTFGELAQQWQRSRESAKQVGETTLYREQGIIDTFCGYIGKTKLKDITPQAIDRLYIMIRDDKKAEYGHFSETTMNKYHKIFKKILSQAVDYGIILRNPADKVKTPKIEDPDRRSLSAREARTLAEQVDEAEEAAYLKRDEIERRQARRGDTSARQSLRGMSKISDIIAVRIGLATGMRRGEVLSLVWDAVDLFNGNICVQQNITVKNKVKAPKTPKGVRNIAIDAKTVSHLRRWKRRQAEELDILCLRQTGSTPVCCSDTGGFINPDNFSRWWRQFRKEEGYPDLKFHELRHTQATQLLSNGVDVTTVQHRLGHKSASTTLDFYAHALPENDEEAAELIGDLFAPQKKEANRTKQRLRIVHEKTA